MTCRESCVVWAACFATAFSVGAAARAQDHSAHQSHAIEGPATEGNVAISRVTRAPDNFVGNVTADVASGRLWLMSFGPPANTKGASTLYQLDPATGRVVASAKMPFRGEFGAAAFIHGSLFQIVPYESRLYEIAVTSGDFGRIIRAVALPTFADITLRDDDVYRYPFISFTGLMAADDDALRLYASDLGEFITVDAQTGRVLKRVPTSKGLSGIAAVTGADGVQMALATFDPVDASFRAEARRFMYRASHGILPLETVRAEGNFGHPGQKTVSWVLLDPDSGEVLAATAIETTRLAAISVAVLKHDPAARTRYGRFVALTTGAEGVLTVEWVPQ